MLRKEIKIARGVSCLVQYQLLMFHRIFLFVCVSYNDGNNLNWCIQPLHVVHFSFFLFFFFFCLFRATLAAYGGSQARGQIRPAAAGLRHSHSDTRSEPCLWPTPQLMAMLDPQAKRLSEAGIEPTPSWILVRFVSTLPPWELPRISF